MRRKSAKRRASPGRRAAEPPAGRPAGPRTFRAYSKIKAKNRRGETETRKSGTCSSGDVQAQLKHLIPHTKIVQGGDTCHHMVGCGASHHPSLV